MYDQQVSATILIFLGAVLLIIGLLLYVSPIIAKSINNLNIPEPLKSILLVKTRLGSIDIYTSPLAIIILTLLYIAFVLGR